jgi:hypothetical protein
LSCAAASGQAGCPGCTQVCHAMISISVDVNVQQQLMESVVQGTWRVCLQLQLAKVYCTLNLPLGPFTARIGWDAQVQAELSFCHTCNVALGSPRWSWVEQGGFNMVLQACASDHGCVLPPCAVVLVLKLVPWSCLSAWSQACQRMCQRALLLGAEAVAAASLGTRAHKPLWQRAPTPPVQQGAAHS